MPLKIDREFPALDLLRSENIFVMDEERAVHQDIRPLQILIVNLMPEKVATEAHLLRHLANTPLQLKVEFLHMASHESKTTPKEHMQTFYKTFDQISNSYYDGMIITGAPVENYSFEEVDYWQEFKELIAWSEKHVYSTLHICWGAQAGLYIRYGIDKELLPKKLSGIYSQEVQDAYHPLLRGFDDSYKAPHSRHTCVEENKVAAVEDLDILAKGKEVGLAILASKDLRQVYSFGHLEYDRGRLQYEYERDLKAGRHPHIPDNYYPQDDVTQVPHYNWNSAAALFFNNWINYAVYQETPYDWTEWSSQL